jgi:hypothetical protein
MNDTLIKLAEQADVTIDGMGYGEGNIEKLAQLIVDECVRVLRADGELAKIQCVPSSLYTYAALNRGANVVAEYFK